LTLFAPLLLVQQPVSCVLRIALKEINVNVVHISQDSYDDLVDRLNGVMADLVMEGRVLSSDFRDDLMLRSALLLDDRKVRINKFNLAWRNQVRD
jgi:hypothetical protein